MSRRDLFGLPHRTKDTPVALWWLMSVRGRSVALRIAGIADRPRRLVCDTEDPDHIREEWRCARCADWVADEAVTWAPSGRDIGTVPELFAYCTPCGIRPEGRLATRSFRSSMTTTASGR